MTHICPRCGYDLEGLIATWVESCPLQAMCSECGLEFDCTRALSPRVIGPRWSYEHGFARESRRWWGTSIIALLPQRMFRELGVDHQINTRRLVRFMILWLIVVHMVTAAVGLMLLIVAQGGGPVFGRAALLFDDQLIPYTLPRLLFPYGYDLSIPTGPMSSQRIPTLPIFLLAYVPTFLMPAWMLLLGTSLRLARVRRLQLLRGTAYSLPCAAVYVAAMMATIIGVPLARTYLGLNVPRASLALVMLFGFGHHLFWWYLFIRRYLRLRHAAAVVALHTVMNVLVLMITFIMLDVLGMRF